METDRILPDVGFLTRCRISMCQGLGPTDTMKFRKSTVGDLNVDAIPEPLDPMGTFGFQGKIVHQKYYTTYNDGNNDIQHFAPT